MNWWVTAIESLVVGGLGGWGTVQGLSKHLGDRWLEGLKAKYSRELEEFKATLEKKQKKVQAEIDTSVFVTRAHFETEFQSMKDLFRVLGDVFLNINGLRPMVSVEPPEEEDTARQRRLSERLQVLTKSYDELVTISTALRPFYPSNLYAVVEECLRAAYSEITDVRTAGNKTFTNEWFQDGKKNQTRYSIAYENAAQMIRERIEALAIIPST
jgi:hypothetical protein